MKIDLTLPRNVGPVDWVGPDDNLCRETGLVHFKRIPSEANQQNRSPVVVMLHGRYGNESAMWIFARLIPQGVAIVSPRGPVETDRGAMWFDYDEVRVIPNPDSLRTGIGTLTQFIACLPKHYPVDPARLVLMGFSQGAMIASALTLAQPNASGGLALLSGAVPPFAGVPRHAAGIAGLPVFIAHGIRDTAIPIETARLARDAFVAAKADVTYGEYSIGHKTNTQGMIDLQRWLSKVFSG